MVVVLEFPDEVGSEFDALFEEVGVKIEAEAEAVAAGGLVGTDEGSGEFREAGGGAPGDVAGGVAGDVEAQVAELL